MQFARNGKPRVAFVVQRCGREVNGGAESLCLALAGRMSRHWKTEILTTCAVDYMQWKNYYAPGEESLDGALIRRFAVDQQRNVARFDSLSAELRVAGTAAPLAQQEAWMTEQGPISSALFSYVREHHDVYDAFVFIGYLYATTYFGLPFVHEKAVLVPCAHDEWPIHLTLWNEFMLLPRAIIFNTPEERQFFCERFGERYRDAPAIGMGVALPKPPDGGAFKRKYGLDSPFLLYAGRIDASKGCDDLFSMFASIRSRHAIDAKLVVIGREVLPVPFHDDIVYLGFVDDEEKWNAMAGCEWLIIPSSFESLSITLLETWCTARPAIVNGTAEVLVGHCTRSNAGLWYHDSAGFEAILTGQHDTTRLGRNGQRYVAEQYSWSRIEDRYRDAVSAVIRVQVTA